MLYRAWPRLQPHGRLAKRKRPNEPTQPDKRASAPQLPSKAIVHEVQYPEGFQDEARLPSNIHGMHLSSALSHC